MRGLRFLRCKSHYRLALLVLICHEVGAIEYGIGKLCYPVAKDEHSLLMRQHKVELYMAMTVDVTVDVRMLLHILLGIEHERLLAFSLEWQFLAILTLQARVLGPCQTEAHGEVRMQKVGEHPLTHAVMEHSAYEAELAVAVTQSVAMSEIEHLSVYLRYQWLTVDVHTTLALQILICPDVMVAGEVMNLHSHVRQLRAFAKEACEALWHHAAPFVPEVEHITEHIHSLRLMLYAVKESHQTAFLHTAMLNSQ